MTCVKTSSLSAISSSGQALLVGSPVLYNTIRVNTGNAIDFNSGDSTIYLKKAGLYLVEFDADFTITTTGTVVFQLMKNGVAVNGVNDTVQATQAEPAGIHFATLVEVKPSCCVVDNTAALTVQTSAIGTLNNGAINVVKVG